MKKRHVPVGRYFYPVAKTEISASTTILTVGVGIGRRAASNQECREARGLRGPVSSADEAAALPLVFHTLVITDGNPDKSDRQSNTWAEAERQHAQVVKVTRGATTKGGR
jgi:hypothetical protein